MTFITVMIFTRTKFVVNITKESMHCHTETRTQNATGKICVLKTLSFCLDNDLFQPTLNLVETVEDYIIQITLLTLSSTEDFSSNNLTYMDVYLLLTKTLKRDYFHREKEN